MNKYFYGYFSTLSLLDFLAYTFVYNNLCVVSKSHCNSPQNIFGLYVVSFKND